MEASDLLRRAEERRRVQLMKQKANANGGVGSKGNQQLRGTHSNPPPPASAPQVVERKSSALAALFPEKGSAWIHKETALLCKTTDSSSEEKEGSKAPVNPSLKAEKGAAPTGAPRKIPLPVSNAPPPAAKQRANQHPRVQSYNSQEAQLFTLGCNPKAEQPPPPLPLPLPQLPNRSLKADADELDTSKKKNSRIRTAVACVSCRASKVRCDGGRPCKRCNKMGRECVNPEPRKRRRGAGEQVNRTSRPQPLFDEHGVKRKALADKFNRHRAQRCYRNAWCTRPYKHPGHCKDYR